MHSREYKDQSGIIDMCLQLIGAESTYTYTGLPNSHTYKIQYTTFRTVEKMCWLLFNKFMILSNSKAIPKYLWNKCTIDCFLKLHGKALIFVRLFLSRRKHTTAAKIYVLFARYLCKINYKYLIDLDLCNLPTIS